MIDVGFWGDPMNSGAGNRSREGKVNGKQSARDIAGWRTSSRPGHEEKFDREEARREQRRERRAASSVEKSGLCSAILLASALSAAGLASQIAQAKGWA
jgi:hypothetical protein